MSNKNNARRTAVEVAFNKVDVSKSIGPYLKAFSYLDNEEDETDEIQIQVHDRDSVWKEKWLNDAIMRHPPHRPLRSRPGAVKPSTRW